MNHINGAFPEVCFRLRGSSSSETAFWELRVAFLRRRAERFESSSAAEEASESLSDPEIDSLRARDYELGDDEVGIPETKLPSRSFSNSASPTTGSPRSFCLTLK